MPVEKLIGRSACFRRICVAELARLRSAKQTHAMRCPSTLAAVELQQPTPRVFGTVAFKPCLPAPNLPVERTC